MGSASLYAFPLLLALGTTPTPLQTAKPGPPTPGGYLSEEDAVYLDHLLQSFLFDPKHAQRVRVRRAEIDNLPRHIRIELIAYSRSELSDRTDGWLVRGQNGKPDRVFFMDGDSIPAPKSRLTPIDFEAETARALAHGHFDNDEEALAIAAWLHRRGYDGLAARALECARARRADDDPEERLRNQLARRAFDQAASAFYAGLDAVAFEHIQRLHQLYQDYLEQFSDLPAFVSDLGRRRAEQVFGRAPDGALPNDFSKWDAGAKLRYLLHSLQDVGSNPQRDFRVLALIEMGDAIVPALIDALEHDDRLCRSQNAERIRGFKRGNSDRFVIVRDAILVTLSGILRCDCLDPLNRGWRIDQSSPAALANQYRRYWADHGRLPFDDRMMAILTNPKAAFGARHEAASELIRANTPRDNSWSKDERRRRDSPSPLITKFRSPTVREAIFEAIDQGVAQRKGASSSQTGELGDYQSAFVRCLSELGDPKAGSELALRARAMTSSSLRIDYARAAQKLGVPGQMLCLVRDIGAGRFDFSEYVNKPHDFDIYGGAYSRLRYLLDESEIAEADEAFYLLADKSHSFYPLLAAAVRTDQGSHRFGPTWSLHPNCITAMKHALDDNEPTGVHYYLRGDEIEVTGERHRGRGYRREKSSPSEKLLEHAEQRAADAMADRIADTVIGVTTSHPLRTDADSRIAKLRRELELYSRRLRPLNWSEQDQWSARGNGLVYIPDIHPLGRPATADDVRLGLAVFELQGKGKLADKQLPAWVVLKTAAKEQSPGSGLAVQAETDADGKLVYGVIFRHEIRAVKAEEVERIEPYDKDSSAYRIRYR